MKERTNRLVWGFVMIVLIAADQASKAYISVNRATFDELSVIPGFFYLTYLENRGAAFSILQNMRWVFVGVTVVAVAAMIYFFLKHHGFVVRSALSLLIAGAVGNLIDRIRQGFVVDFLHFYPFGYNFPVFNLADICVDVGAVLLAVWLLFLYRDPEPAKRTNPEISGDSEIGGDT